MRLEVVGDIEDFAVCFRDHRVDPTMSDKFCGAAFCVQRVWIGDPTLDSVRGTLISGLDDLIKKENLLSDPILFDLPLDEAQTTFLSQETIGSQTYRFITDIGDKHSLTASCECFDGFYLFAVAYEERVRLFHIDYANPLLSFIYETSEKQIFDALLHASNFLSSA